VHRRDKGKGKTRGSEKKTTGGEDWKSGARIRGGGGTRYCSRAIAQEHPHALSERPGKLVGPWVKDVKDKRDVREKRGFNSGEVKKSALGMVTMREVPRKHGGAAQT